MRRVAASAGMRCVRVANDMSADAYSGSEDTAVRGGLWSMHTKSVRGASKTCGRLSVRQPSTSCVPSSSTYGVYSSGTADDA